MESCLKLSLYILIAVSVSCSSLQSKDHMRIEIKGSLLDPEFERSFVVAKQKLAVFARENGWEDLITSKSFLEKVEVFPTKEAFDNALKNLSNGQMKSVPKSFVAVMDNRVLRVIAWKAYQQIHPDETLQDYEKLLTHEMAHQLHVDILKGDQDRMGPVWFYEGFSVLAAQQYESFSADSNSMREAISNIERGNYKVYGSILRKILKTKNLSILVDGASKVNFNSEVLMMLQE